MPDSQKVWIPWFYSKSNCVSKMSFIAPQIEHVT